MLLPRIPLSKFSTQVLCASCSEQISSIRMTLSYLKVAPELRKCTSRTTFIIESCDFQPELRKFNSRNTFAHKSCGFPRGAAKVYFAYYFRTYKLRLSSRSCESALRALLSHFKVATLRICESVLRTRILLSISKAAIFQPELGKCTSPTTFVLKKLRFSSRSYHGPGGIEPATARLQRQARKPCDNFLFEFRWRNVPARKCCS